MKSFNDFVNESISTNNYFNYSDTNDLDYTEIGHINEASLSRLLSQISKKDFCIVTAFRHENTKNVNKKNNQELLQYLNSLKLGPYNLIGHWSETPDGGDWDTADKSTLIDSVEDSFLFTRPDTMDSQKFVDICLQIQKKYKQDAIVVGLSGTVYLYFGKDKRDQIAKDVKLNKINQAYSQMRGKENIPFVFEGTRAFESIVLGRGLFQKIGINWVR
ncbi:hypothetical protein D9V86_06755 [Bacteroidetes/Chlorobi group bacterium ChocPot_Mid]|nr:MAG: hypothetical protein D9V86_06755 [Bacteroidetes/Chlorobi group bacterium ChocPot_Mid]